jgi:hypothetical protein
VKNLIQIIMDAFKKTKIENSVTEFMGKYSTENSVCELAYYSNRLSAFVKLLLESRAGFQAEAEELLNAI